MTSDDNEFSGERVPGDEVDHVVNESELIELEGRLRSAANEDNGPCLETGVDSVLRRALRDAVLSQPIDEPPSDEEDPEAWLAYEISTRVEIAVHHVLVYAPRIIELHTREELVAMARATFEAPTS